MALALAVSASLLNSQNNCVQKARLPAPTENLRHNRLIDMPIDTRAAQMLLGSLRQLGTELLYPSEHRRSIHRDAALRQKIHDILIRQRITKVPTHRAQDDLTGKAVVFERGFSWHTDLKSQKIAKGLT